MMNFACCNRRILSILGSSFLCLVVFSLFFSPLLSRASSTEAVVSLVPGQEQHINSMLQYLDDPTGKLTVEDVEAGKGGQFKPLLEPSYGFGFSGVRWVKFTLDFSKLPSDDRWFIEQGYLHVQNWRLYYPNKSGVYEYTAVSEDYPTSARPFFVHNYILKIPKEFKSKAVYYASFDPGGHPLNIDLSVMPEKIAIEEMHAKVLGIGLFFGGLGVLLLYNAFLCIQLKSKDYAYYIYYLLFFIGAYFYLTGMAPLVVDLDMQWRRVFATCAYLTIHGMVLFGRHILRLKENFSFADKYLCFFGWILLLGSISPFIFSVSLAYRTLNILILLSLPMLMIGGAKRAYDGYAPAKIYVTGWVLFVIAQMAYTLYHLGVISPSFFAVYGIQVASVLEATLFSFALALRFKMNSEAAALAKNSFIAMVSHELKTPLQSIISCLDLMHGRGQILKGDKLFEKLRSATDHLDAQVNDLTDYSRLESGKLSLTKTTFDVAAIVNDVASDYLPKAESKGLKLSVVLPENTFFVYADPMRIKQVLNNLTENAIKYTQTGHVEIKMSAVEAGDKRLLFEISDSGIGIDKSHVRSIYEPFTQVDQSVQRKYSGIGMGLTIVRSLVSLMGGSIEVQSIPEEGSVFKVSIPFGDPAFRDGETEEAEKSVPRLLLIDDNDEVRLMLREILEDIKYEVDDFCSGREALSAAKARKYNAILLDVNMPDMNGFQVAAALRENPSYREAPIIWISATKPSLRDQEKSVTFNYFLEKPIRRATVEKLLRSIFH